MSDLEPESAPNESAAGRTKVPAQDERNESAIEKLDRNWMELLQELRVLQTGVQILAGFLLTLPFQSRFETLDDYQTTLYLANVALAALTTALILLPVSVHRRLFRLHLRAALVSSADRIAKVCPGLRRAPQRRNVVAGFRRHGGPGGGVVGRCGAAGCADCPAGLCAEQAAPAG